LRRVLGDVQHGVVGGVLLVLLPQQRCHPGALGTPEGGVLLVDAKLTPPGAVSPPIWATARLTERTGAWPAGGRSPVGSGRAVGCLINVAVDNVWVAAGAGQEEAVCARDGARVVRGGAMLPSPLPGDR
jgi:hypothetical protein